MRGGQEEEALSRAPYVWGEPRARGCLHLGTDLGGTRWAGGEIQNKETDLRGPWKKVGCQDMWAWEGSGKKWGA